MTYTGNRLLFLNYRVKTVATDRQQSLKQLCSIFRTFRNTANETVYVNMIVSTLKFDMCVTSFGVPN